MKAIVVALLFLITPVYYELAYCENGRCTTVTDNTGICPPTSIQVGQHCIFQ